MTRRAALSAGQPRRRAPRPRLPEISRCARAWRSPSRPSTWTGRPRPRPPRASSVITTPENRWGRCDIKTVGLLPNALAKQAARGGRGQRPGSWTNWASVTEGALVQRLDRRRATASLRTRDTNANILRGVTRSTLLDVIREAGDEASSERPFTLDEALAAKEAFITGAGSLVLPVDRRRRQAGRGLDGRTGGDEAPALSISSGRATYGSAS